MLVYLNNGGIVSCNADELEQLIARGLVGGTRAEASTKGITPKKAQQKEEELILSPCDKFGTPEDSISSEDFRKRYGISSTRVETLDGTGLTVTGKENPKDLLINTPINQSTKAEVNL